MKSEPCQSYATTLRRHVLEAGGRPALGWVAVVVLGLLVGAGGVGCSSSGEDLNVLIPKMIDKWKGPSNVDAAADLFNATNPDARRIAVAYISMKKWGHEAPYMKAYHVLATSDPDSLVRAQALRALGTSHQMIVADDLLTGLASTNEIVRRDAAAAMSDINNPILIEPLLEHLKTDPDAQTRINSAHALNQYREPRVYKALAEALDDKDVAVEHRAWLSLQDIFGVALTCDRSIWVGYLASRKLEGTATSTPAGTQSKPG